MIKTNTDDLASLLKQLANPRPALEQIGEALVQSTRERLEKTKVSPEGQKWAPWSLSTLLARRKKGTAARGLLFDSGNLSNSIQAQVLGDSVIVGASAKYASFLQNGTENMPARPFVGISRQDEARIHGILSAHLEKR